MHARMAVNNSYLPTYSSLLIGITVYAAWHRCWFAAQFQLWQIIGKQLLLAELLPACATLYVPCLRCTHTAGNSTHWSLASVLITWTPTQPQLHKDFKWWDAQQKWRYKSTFLWPIDLPFRPWASTNYQWPSSVQLADLVDESLPW